ncbi:PTS glucitol/sorbitol transporter subunit IIA [Streptococcus halichoeri]|uniref:PTS glucitol/sorbitol transporter subunit IIA n=1 Tax=Streptococcus halichoeri TaxID=254785 RepID=UPI001C8CF70D|nr:PTS glucitol/sorbitol transporter subunit IIA [Streptococcus halichoeri]
MEKFYTKVKEVGPKAQTMITDANMLILFGEGAPLDLSDYCFMIDNQQLKAKIEVGDTLAIDSFVYKVKAVGSLVEQNLTDLGHISVCFDQVPASLLPGTLYVAGGSLPLLAKGTEVIIYQ